MLIYNGTDYTLYIIVAVTILVIFAVQYILCVKSKRAFVKLLPAGYVLFIMILAIICYLTPDTSGFIDLSATVALLLCGYAGICLVVVSLAWIIYKMWSGKKCG